jgi:1,4-dihydroxy-2-naphthoate octaprenyltransferase
MVEPSNITIGIVSDVSGGWRRKALGWFLEFRTIPVLLWSYTSVALGTALAFLDGARIDPLWFLVAMALAGLVQGWETHAINEIFDWRSGTDRDGSPRALSGGSKVLNLGLLGERDLWIVFAASTVAVAGLAAVVVLMRVGWLVLLIAAGYVLGLVYTLPPVSTAYRPVAGEFLGGFPGVLLAGLGAYAIQTLRLSWVAVAAISAHAFVCTAMLVMHHYLDAPSDAAAVPVKRTTVVVLGPERARVYATVLALAGAVAYGLAAALVHPAFLAGFAITLAAMAFHARTDPTDLQAVTRNELRVIQLGIAAGLSTAVLIAPDLWPLVPIAAVGYLVHLAAVAPPPALARAWRAAPAAHGRGRPK